MRDIASNRADVDIRRYWDVLLSRWPVIVAMTGLGLLVAATVLLVVPRTYVVSTTLSVSPITTDPFAANRNSNNLVDMNAEAITASSFRVAEIAAEATDGRWDSADLRMNTTAMSDADSTTMVITVSAPSEELARIGAGAMADAYLSARSDQAAGSIAAGVDRDRERIQEYRAQLAEATTRLAEAQPGSPAAAEATTDQQILNTQISALVSRMSSLQGVDTTGGTILNPASVTTASIEPSATTLLLTGFAAGFIAGVIVAFVTHSRRSTVRSAQDLRRELEIETLGTVNAGETEDVAIVAQRLLRLAELEDARVVALVFDVAVSRPDEMVDQLVSNLREAGVVVAVASPSQVEDEESAALVLVPVEGDASQAARLHALRRSDIALLMVASGETRLKSLSRLIDEASEMGSRVVGAVITTRKATGRRRSR